MCGHSPKRVSGVALLSKGQSGGLKMVECSGVNGKIRLFPCRGSVLEAFYAIFGFMVAAINFLKIIIKTIITNIILAKLTTPSKMFVKYNL